MLTPDLSIKLMEQLKKELDDVCKYRELEKLVNDSDPYLADALDEIADDEYYHAKFLRKFLMSESIYKPTEQVDIEKKWMHINE